MPTYLLTISCLLTLLLHPASTSAQSSAAVKDITYTTVISGYDWGAGVNKVILPLANEISDLEGLKFDVAVRRSWDKQSFSGKRRVVHRYISDKTGRNIGTGKYITLVLGVSPTDPLSSPFQYLRGRNRFVTYDLTITETSKGQVWNKENKQLFPELDKFDLTGKFEYEPGKTMHYASFAPSTKQAKQPLIIWLHGGGEGGTDPRIPLLANKAANYAAPEIQVHFGGAYVLVPQSPGAWMHNEKGISTWGEENDVYNQGLMRLIKDFVANHPDIDQDRIYVGGCSNGGYMSIKLMLLYPDYFAASFPSAIAYKSAFLTDAQIASIKHIPSWYIHSADDPVTPAATTVIPVYERLIAAGAKNVHCSLFDHVIDPTNMYGGEDFHYLGHFSWIYSHNNDCYLDYDGSPVMMNDQPVSLMEWLAAQRR